ncbi:MAG TPA: S-layer homology domain-containing protein [Bacillota bacterium]|nr:S-layer homology domain-containing protein [Bacillota bacterium]
MKSNAPLLRRRICGAACAVALTLAVLPAPALAAAPAGGGAPPPGAAGATRFTDITGNWAAGYIQTLLEAGVLTVPADGLFDPGDPVSRLDFSVWVSKALELPAVATPLPVHDAGRIPQTEQGNVAAAVAAGLLQGFPDGTFQPDAPITRAQIATIFGRNLQSRGEVPEARYTQLFLDGASIPDWARPATIVIKDQLIYGEPCTPLACFAPEALTTRAEATTLLVRFLEYLSAHYHQAPLRQAAPRAGFTAGMWYSNSDQAYANLQQDGTGVNELIYGGYDIIAGGLLQGYDSPRTLAWAGHHPDVPLWVMVQASSLSFLTSDQQAQSLLGNLVTIVRRAGYAGVNFDIEGIPGAERAAYTTFITNAAGLLHGSGAKVSVAVPSETAANLGESWDAAYDYPALGRVVDQLITMTYDYHYAGGNPGPVAPISWARDVIAYASGVMPPSKVILGLPVYGYIWNVATDGGTAYWESGMENEAGLHGATITHNAGADEGTFTYAAGGSNYVGWFVDAQGAADRLALAHDAGIGGVMGWRMDYNSPDWWPAFGADLAAWR